MAVPAVKVLSDEHISALLRFGFGPDWASQENRAAVQYAADGLKEENIHSFNEYAQDLATMVVPCVVDFTQGERSPVEILKLIHTYEANSDQLGTYHGDYAAGLIRSIRNEAICRLAGYHEAPAGV